MTKSELVESIFKRFPSLNMNEIRMLVDIIFGQITEALAAGNRVEIRGFGTMSVRKRKPRQARNPRTNESIQLGERSVVYFRTGKDFRKRLNPSNDEK